MRNENHLLRPLPAPRSLASSSSAPAPKRAGSTRSSALWLRDRKINPGTPRDRRKYSIRCQKRLLKLDSKARGENVASSYSAQGPNLAASIEAPLADSDAYERIKAMHPAKQWHNRSRRLGEVIALSPPIGEGGWTPVVRAAFAVNASWLELYHLALTCRASNGGVPRFEWRCDASGFDEIRSNPALAPAPAAPPRYRGTRGRGGMPKLMMGALGVAMLFTCVTGGRPGQNTAVGLDTSKQASKAEHPFLEEAIRATRDDLVLLSDPLPTRRSCI